jgi:hypothetical protein
MTNQIRLSPPNLPLAPDTYSLLFQNTYSNVLRLFFNSLSNSINTPDPYGLFYDTTSQTNPVGGAVNLLVFGKTGISTACAAQGGNRVYVAQDGVYNIQFTAQLQKGGAGASTAAFWFMQNGFNIADSAKYSHMSGGVNSQYTISWNWVLQLHEKDYLQLAWSSADTTITLPTVAATATVPESPSIVLTVTWISSPFT